jgi:hypothetical protein
MTDIPLAHQGRAPGLYDEQLQRQHQEKLLLRARKLPSSRRALFQAVPADADA